MHKLSEKSPLFRLLFLTLILASPPASVIAYELHYELRVSEPPLAEVAVEAILSFLPTDVDSLHLDMIERYAYVKLDAPLFETEPSATTPAGDTLVLKRDAPYRWTLATAGRSEVRLNYTVPLTHRDLPAVIGRDEYEQPYLEDDHGLLVTGTLFIAPADADIIRVRILPPDGWPVICPWAELEPGIFSPANRDALFDDLIPVGAWSLHRFESGGCEIDIAFAPGQKELEQAAKPIVTSIVKSEIDLFGVRPNERYLFVFTDPAGPGFSGSPKTCSMVLSAAAEGEELPLYPLSHITAHEFHHTWMHVSFRPPDELRFYNEGFTDYFAFLVCARLGLHSWEEFANELGTRMARCAENPHFGTLSLSEAGGDFFFEDSGACNLVYHGGTLVAALLDREIRAAGKGLTLDHFMRAFNNDTRWSLESCPGMDDFESVLAEFVGAEQAARYRRLVEEPYILDPVREFERLEAPVERKKKGVFRRKLRFDVDPDPWRSHQAVN